MIARPGDGAPEPLPELSDCSRCYQASLSAGKCSSCGFDERAAELAERARHDALELAQFRRRDRYLVPVGVGAVLVALFMGQCIGRDDGIELGRRLERATLRAPSVAQDPLDSLLASYHATPSGTCRDQTVTYSDGKRGACSHHGGVAEWFGRQPESRGQW